MTHSLNGPSERQLRVSEIVRRLVVDILLKGRVADADIIDQPITISEVRISPDLRQAKVFCSLFNKPENTDKVIDALNRNAPFMRKLVAQKMTSKTNPKLTFCVDETLNAAADLTDKLNALKKK
jgi:ribosome-binding factor A